MGKNLGIPVKELSDFDASSRKQVLFVNETRVLALIDGYYDESACPFFTHGI